MARQDEWAMTNMYTRRDLTRRGDLCSTFQGCQQLGLSGPRAFIAAILVQAAIDAEDGDKGAREFFDSAAYRHYLAWLDLPGDWRPVGMERRE